MVRLLCCTVQVGIEDCGEELPNVSNRAPFLFSSYVRPMLLFFALYMGVRLYVREIIFHICCAPKKGEREGGGKEMMKGYVFGPLKGLVTNCHRCVCCAVILVVSSW